MAAGKFVHDGGTEITNDETPRSPGNKRDQKKSEPKGDAHPRLGVGPKPQNDRIAKSKATAVHNVLKTIALLPSALSFLLVDARQIKGIYTWLSEP